MTITPIRLLLLCIVTFLVFYGLEENLKTRPAKAEGSHYRLEDGSLMVSIESGPFSIDPLSFVKNESSESDSNEVFLLASNELPVDCPFPKAYLPSEAALAGEVARASVDDVQCKSRVGFIDGLLQAPEESQKDREEEDEEKAKEQGEEVPSFAQARKTYKSNPRRAIDLFSRMLSDKKQKPSLLAASHYWKGKAHKRIHEPITAIRHMEKAIDLAPKRASYLNGLAWTLVTTYPKRLRDPKRAYELAQKAVELSQRKRANYLDTLAKAQFELGKAEEAFETQQAAVVLAPHRRSFSKRLRVYEMAITAD